MEVIVGVAILSAVLFGLAQVGQLTLRLVNASNLQLRASFLAEEGLEAARLGRDSSWATNITPKTLCTDYYLSFSNGAWQITTTPAPLVDGIFDRRVRFEAVTRNALDDIIGTNCAETGSDPGSRKVTVIIQWPERGGRAVPSLSTGLVGYWNFDVGVGGATAYDVSGNEHHGALTNMDPATNWVTGKVGTALDFDGGNDIINLESPAGLDDVVPFTYCMWIYPRHHKGGATHLIHKFRKTFFEKTASQQNRYALSVVRQSTHADAQSQNDLFELGVWQFACATYSETDGPRLYKNGVEANYTMRTVGNGATETDAAAGMFLGNDDLSTTRSFRGIMDEVRIYSRVLSAEEIRQLYYLTRMTISTYLTDLFNN